jgi:hypothetical protein
VLYKGRFKSVTALRRFKWQNIQFGSSQIIAIKNPGLVSGEGFTIPD